MICKRPSVEDGLFFVSLLGKSLVIVFRPCSDVESCVIYSHLYATHKCACSDTPSDKFRFDMTRQESPISIFRAVCCLIPGSGRQSAVRATLPSFTALCCTVKLLAAPSSGLYTQQASQPAQQASQQPAALSDTLFSDFQKHFAKGKSSEKIDALNALIEAGNSHTIEALDLAMKDPDYTVQFTATQQLKSIAFEEFPLFSAPYDSSQVYSGLLNDGGRAYYSWHNRIKVRSVEESIRLVENELVHTISEGATEAIRNAALTRLMYADYKSSTPFALLRMSVAKGAGVSIALGSMVAKTNSPSAAQMYAFSLFQADEASLERSVLPIARACANRTVRASAIATLARVGSPQAYPLISDIIRSTRDDENDDLLFNAVAACTDVRLIPLYLGALESGFHGYLSKQMVLSLKRISRSDIFTQTPADMQFVGPPVMAWEQWWRDNKDQFPLAARNLPVPRLKWRISDEDDVRYYPGRTVWREAGGERKRGYWLVCPRLSARSVDSAGPETGSGLIVALPPDKSGNADATRLFWSDACSAAFNNRYFIAIPANPDVVSDTNRKSDTSAEDMVEAIVSDISSEFDINPAHRWLFGSESTGLIAFRCALREKTAFAGYVMVNAKFQSLLLPSFQYVTGRHFVIQSSPKNSVAPAWQSAAGAKILTSHGATVHLNTIGDASGYTVVDNRWKSLVDGVNWLEHSPKSSGTVHH